MAGFCIFNDISARDVQALEFVGGFCLTKDMAQGNQLGPYLSRRFAEPAGKLLPSRWPVRAPLQIALELAFPQA